MKTQNLPLKILLFLNLCFTSVFSQGIEWMNVITSKDHGINNTIDNGWKAAIDKYGNGYAGGKISASAQFGDIILSGDPIDMFVCKYDSRGKFLWANLIKVGKSILKLHHSNKNGH